MSLVMKYLPVTVIVHQDLIVPFSEFYNQTYVPHIER